mmetsp:Transcript_31185/g.77758  ORF Transcript_31185/g.77758 Transcript_31185/m.77758 type:complete len:252 (-) Transcript_31185:3850-4605(-)
MHLVQLVAQFPLGDYENRHFLVVFDSQIADFPNHSLHILLNDDTLIPCWYLARATTGGQKERYLVGHRVESLLNVVTLSLPADGPREAEDTLVLVVHVRCAHSEVGGELLGRRPKVFVHEVNQPSMGLWHFGRFAIYQLHIYRFPVFLHSGVVDVQLLFITFEDPVCSLDPYFPVDATGHVPLLSSSGERLHQVGRLQAIFLYIVRGGLLVNHKIVHLIDNEDCGRKIESTLLHATRKVRLVSFLKAIADL